MVVAGSVNETYKRNALNNGLLVVECAALVDAVKARYKARSERSTIIDDGPISVDLVGSAIRWYSLNMAVDFV